LLAGTPANVTLGTLPLLCAVVGPVPNDASPSTRYPQVLTANVVGVLDVPLEAAKLVLAPCIALFVVLVVMVSE